MPPTSLPLPVQMMGRKLEPGDGVDEQTVDRIVLELLPTTYRDDLRQAGEAFSRAIDPDTEMPAYTHMTFAKMVNLDGPDYWVYCGYCFAGKKVEPFEVQQLREAGKI